MSKSYSFEVLGQTYRMRSERPEEEVAQVLNKIKDEFARIHDLQPSLTLQDTAVLACLNLADQYDQLEKTYHTLLALLDEQVVQKS